MSLANTLSITEARGNIFNIADEAQKRGVHFTLTEHGRPKAVLMSADEFESWQETLEVIAEFPDLKKDIKEAENDDAIEAIILEIDSYGGSPVGAEEIANALKNTKKPTVALIREGGVSAGYWAATGADRIVASKNSDVGGIGVTGSYLDYSGQNEKEGIIYNQLSSGKFKDAGDPDKALTQEERNLFMRDVNILHQNFIKIVAQNRNLDIKKVEALADGSSMLGEMALKNGLIDQIGGELEVIEYIESQIIAQPQICW